MSLSSAQQDRLLARVRIALEAGWGARPKAPIPEPAPLDGPLSGCFVTLQGPDGLRGCRGVLGDEAPPAEQVFRSARLAAFEDPRFPPVAREEAEALQVEVSLLRGRRRVRHLEEVELGRDGLLLTLGPRQGFLLPQVAVERGWDRARFMAALCAKAGLPADAWRHPEARLEAFEVEHFSAPFRAAPSPPPPPSAGGP